MSACVNWDGVCVGKMLVKLNCVSVCVTLSVLQDYEKERKKKCVQVHAWVCVRKREREKERGRKNERDTSKKVGIIET